MSFPLYGGYTPQDAKCDPRAFAWRTQMDAYQRMIRQEMAALATPQMLIHAPGDVIQYNPLPNQEETRMEFKARRVVRPVEPLKEYRLGKLVLTKAEADEYRRHYEAQRPFVVLSPNDGADKLFQAMNALDNDHELTAPRTYDYEVHNSLMGPKRQSFVLDADSAQRWAINYCDPNPKQDESGYMLFHRAVAKALRAAGVNGHPYETRI